MKVEMFSNTKLRILISGYLPPPMGGIGTYYQTLLNSSLPTQVDLRFVETSSKNRPLSNSGNWSLINIYAAVTDWYRFVQAMISHRPEVTHIATALGLSFAKHSICVMIARLMGSKVLLHPHCSFLTLYSRTSKPWQWFFRNIIRLTDGVVALSSEWHQLKEVVPSCQVYDLPNGVRLSQYSDIGIERNHSKNNHVPFRVLYIGYIGKAKGSFDLVSAAEKMIAHNDRLLFDLVGNELFAGELEQLKKQISDAGLERFVKIHPVTVGNGKLDLLRAADLFTYPSYHEGMPMAIIEAMACGLPVVATRVGGIPDLVTLGVNGLLIEPGHPDQLAEAIHRVVIDSDLRESMQASSFEIAHEKYDIEKLVVQLVNIYRTVLFGKRELQEA